VKLPDKQKCLRAWAVASLDDYDHYAVYVELKNTENEEITYWSNGKKIIGHKEGDESKDFKKIEFPDGLKIKEFKTYARKIIVQDSNDELWGWGKLDNKEFGNDDVPRDGTKTPTKLANLNSLGKV
jgi:hypothetical protein